MWETSQAKVLLSRTFAFSRAYFFVLCAMIVFAFWGSLSWLLPTASQLLALNSSWSETFYSDYYEQQDDIIHLKKARLACNSAVVCFVVLLSSSCEGNCCELKKNASKCCFLVSELRNETCFVLHYEVGQNMLSFLFWIWIISFSNSYDLQPVDLILFFLTGPKQIFELYNCSVSWVASNHFRS